MRKILNYLFSKKPTHRYELFTYSDGGRELWRIDLSGRFYPETYFMLNWVSDFGLGDYGNNKRLATKIEIKTELEVQSLLPTFIHFDEIDFQKYLGKEIITVSN